MSASEKKKASGHANRQASAERLRDALREADKIEESDYRALLGPPPLDDPSQAVLWAAKVGTQLIWETLRDPALTTTERRKAVANLIARVGLVSSKSQFAGRIEAIEKKLSAIGNGAVESKPPEQGSDVVLIPAKGTPLWKLWQEQGQLPPESVNAIEVPETARRYSQWLDAERAKKDETK